MRSRNKEESTAVVYNHNQCRISVNGVTEKSEDVQKLHIELDNVFETPSNDKEFTRRLFEVISDFMDSISKHTDKITIDISVS